MPNTVATIPLKLLRPPVPRFRDAKLAFFKGWISLSVLYGALWIPAANAGKILLPVKQRLKCYVSILIITGLVDQEIYFC